jgi:hypothetical protein
MGSLLSALRSLSDSFGSRPLFGQMFARIRGFFGGYLGGRFGGFEYSRHTELPTVLVIVSIVFLN